MRRAAVLTLALLLCAFVGVALAKTKHLTATESDGLAFSTSKITVTHGSVTLVMKNPTANHLQHSIDIKGHGISKKGKAVDPGGTSTVTATLPKGTYTFYCHVSDHIKEGMKGKLVVK
jgi:plastocyanin